MSDKRSTAGEQSVMGLYLRDRFGLAGSKRVTLLEVGRKHGLSNERARQIQKKALRKIRAPNSVQNLKVYAN